MAKSLDYVVSEAPAQVADRIRTFVERTTREGDDDPTRYVDNEAARYGGISLMGMIGAIWLLRPDGTLWEVDDDMGRPLRPLPSEWHTEALVYGAERHPWLAQLLPARPTAAQDCPLCSGQGLVHHQGASCGLACPRCRGLGWVSVEHG